MVMNSKSCPEVAAKVRNIKDKNKNTSAKKSRYVQMDRNRDVSVLPEGQGVSTLCLCFGMNRADRIARGME